MTGWGYSLANLAELLFGCLDAIEAKSVLEIGAYKGELSEQLLDWAAGTGATITALDPEPPTELLELCEARPELELVRQTSHDALREITLPDAIILDGDHNYFTLSEELRLIAERAGGDTMPLLMFHDVSWPHARRDSYYVPERIPEEHRQPLVRDARVVPWEPGVVDAGLPFAWAAEQEGGAENGTLTALEDFVAAYQGVRLAAVPAFFGFGVMWQEDAPWADAVAALVEPWDRSTLLERLEENRVVQLAMRHRLTHRLQQAHELAAARSDRIRELESKVREQGAMLEERRRRALEVGERLNELTGRLNALTRRMSEQEHLLRAMLSSRAFGLAERISRLHQRDEPVISRERIRRVLDSSGG